MTSVPTDRVFDLTVRTGRTFVVLRLNLFHNLLLIFHFFQSLSQKTTLSQCQLITGIYQSREFISGHCTLLVATDIIGQRPTPIKPYGKGGRQGTRRHGYGDLPTAGAQPDPEEGFVAAPSPQQLLGLEGVNLDLCFR